VLIIAPYGTPIAAAGRDKAILALIHSFYVLSQIAGGVARIPGTDR
jgi:hypothetical protein